MAGVRGSPAQANRHQREHRGNHIATRFDSRRDESETARHQTSAQLQDDERHSRHHRNQRGAAPTAGFPFTGRWVVAGDALVGARDHPTDSRSTGEPTDPLSRRCPRLLGAGTCPGRCKPLDGGAHSMTRAHESANARCGRRRNTLPKASSLTTGSTAAGPHGAHGGTAGRLAWSSRCRVVERRSLTAPRR